MEIKKVGICGLGLMGTGIAEIAAKAGVDVVAMEVADKFLEKGLGRIGKSLTRAVDKGEARRGRKKSGARQDQRNHRCQRSGRL